MHHNKKLPESSSSCARVEGAIGSGTIGRGVALDAEAVDVVFVSVTAGAVLWQRQAGSGEDDIQG